MKSNKFYDITKFIFISKKRKWHQTRKNVVKPLVIQKVIYLNNFLIISLFLQKGLLILMIGGFLGIPTIPH